MNRTALKKGTKHLTSSWWYTLALVLILIITASTYWQLSSTQAIAEHEHVGTIIEKSRLVITTITYWQLSYAQAIPEQEQFHTIMEKTRLESNGIVYLWLQRFLLEQFGRHKLVLRSLPMLSGLLTIIIVFYLGKALHDIRLGLAAAFLQASNIFCTGLACHDRFYACNELWVTAATFCLVKALQSVTALTPPSLPPELERRPHDHSPGEKMSYAWWSLYALTMILCTTTMLLSVQVLLLHALLLLFTFRSSMALRAKDYAHSPTSETLKSQSVMPNPRIVRPAHRWICALVIWSLIALLSLALMAALTYRDRHAMTRFHNPTLSLEELEKQVTITMGSGYCRSHFAEHAKVPSGISLYQQNQLHNSLMSLTIFLAIWSLFRPLPGSTSQKHRHMTTPYPYAPPNLIYPHQVQFRWAFVVFIITIIGFDIGFSLWGKNIIKSCSFSWTMPLVAVWLADILLTYRPLAWLWLALLMACAPLLTQMTYVNGPGNENTYNWLLANVKPDHIVMMDTGTHYNFNLYLGADSDHSLLEHTTLYEEPLFARKEIHIDEHIEEYRLLNALRQVPLNFKHKQKVWILTNYRDDRYYDASVQGRILADYAKKNHLRQSIYVTSPSLDNLRIYFLVQEH